MKTVAELKCEAKTKFASLNLAQVNAERVMRRRPSQLIFVYKCQVCSYWHLTKKGPRP